jgi:GAF domain-containing protein
MPILSGICGHIATTGETVNIPDAYLDSRFNPAADTKSGYRTRSILGMSVKDLSGQCVAVLQLVNKVGITGVETFRQADEEMLAVFCSFAGISLRNAKAYRSQTEEKRKAKQLLELSKEISSCSLDRESLCRTIAARTHSMISCESCALYSVVGNHIVSTAVIGQLDGCEKDRVEQNRGYLGAVMSQVGPHAYESIANHPSFDKDVDGTPPSPTSILTYVLRSDAARPIAIIALRRKLSSGTFDTADKEFLEGIGHVAELALKNCVMFETQQLMRRGLESLVQATRVVSSASNAEQLCHAVVHVNLLHVERIDVWRPDGDGLSQVHSAPIASRGESGDSEKDLGGRRRTLSKGLSLSKIVIPPSITYRNNIRWSEHNHPAVCCANERERIVQERRVYYPVVLKEDEGEVQLEEPKLFAVLEFSLGHSSTSDADDLMHLQAFAEHVNEVVKSISLHNKMGEMHDSLQQMISTITSYVFVLAPNKTLSSVNHDVIDFGWDLEMLYETPYPIWLSSQNIQIVNDLDAAYSKAATRRKVTRD